jgi:hypothetical protein
MPRSSMMAWMASHFSSVAEPEAKLLIIQSRSIDVHHLPQLTCCGRLNEARSRKGP